MDVVRLPSETLLERTALPYRQLARFALRESRRPRPIYQVHKWFARRLGCAFRALLVAATSRPSADFWDAYYEEAELRGVTVLDPFVGGGTSVIEALRLGATAIGVDVDPVACAVARLETTAASLPDLAQALEVLKARVGRRLARYHQVKDVHGRRLTILHHFWVQVVQCTQCGESSEAHPNYFLAYDHKRQWSVCSSCGDVVVSRAGVETVGCRCGQRTRPRVGSVAKGVLTCQHCGHRVPLIDVGRQTGMPPSWRLFAVEAFSPTDSRKMVPMTERMFLRAWPRVQRLYDNAARSFARHVGDGDVELPATRISRGRNDDRLVDYGYRRWTDLFNARQLLHHSLLAEAIQEFDKDVRVPLAIAFSNHLATNCMMTAYAAGWRRLTPIFGVRAFRHIPRPVELNPWVEGTGRGTFPNALRQLTRAAAFARLPMEPSRRGKFRAVPSIAPKSEPKIICGTARRLAQLESESIDLVLTDPPYFDNVDYAELAEFYAPWLAMLGIVSHKERRIVRTESLSGDREDPASLPQFARRLGRAFTEIARVLRPDSMLVFTFRHTLPEAWYALAQALARAPLSPMQVLPLPGEVGIGLHAHEGTITWDAALVFRKRTPRVSGAPAIFARDVTLAELHAGRCRRRLRGVPLAFSDADFGNLRRATLVAASRGLFVRRGGERAGVLLDALRSTG